MFDRNRGVKRFHQQSENDRNTTSNDDSYQQENEFTTHIKTAKKFSDSDDQERNEILEYFEQILYSLKGGLDIESKELFSNNVLAQSKGFEVRLANHGSTTHCIELLLSQCSDPAIFSQFMIAFAEEKLKVFTSAKASHITEKLIYVALENMQNWTSIIHSSADSEKQKQVTDIIMWLNDLGQFCVENFNELLQNNYACHVLTCLIQALGGKYSDEKRFASKKSKMLRTEHKKDFGEENIAEKKSISLEQIPKFFVKTLKSLSKMIIEQENLEEIICEGSSATVVESLLSILNDRLPKLSKKVVAAIATTFSRRDNEGIPLAFLHQTSSYVVENIFEIAQEEQQKELWEEYFVPCLEQLIVHRMGNFMVQRLFDVVTSKAQFEIMSDAVDAFFDKIYETRFGIFVSIAAACNKFKVKQVQFMQNIMECLQCHESEDRQLHLVPLLLGMKKYNLQTEKSKRESSNIEICLQGSLIVQAILRFYKPIKAVKSILNMKPKDLAFMANHIQGCHVLTCFFEDNHIGEKNKDNLIHHMKPVFPDIASDRGGSLTLSRMWVLFSLKQKSLLITELLSHENKLRDNRNATAMMNKFGVFYYKTDYDKWKEFNLNISNSRTGLNKVCKSK